MTTRLERHLTEASIYRMPSTFWSEVISYCNMYDKNRRGQRKNLMVESSFDARDIEIRWQRGLNHRVSLTWEQYCVLLECLSLESESSPSWKRKFNQKESFVVARLPSYLRRSRCQCHDHRRSFLSPCAKNREQNKRNAPRKTKHSNDPKRQSGRAVGIAAWRREIRWWDKSLQAGLSRACVSATWLTRPLHVTKF